MSKTESAILLISCQDQIGLVAEVSFFISTYNGNIISSDQHNDSSGAFFMRVEWDLKGFKISRNKIAQAFEPLAEKYNMEWNLSFSAERPKIALMVSRYNHCLLELLHQHNAGELDCEIVQIISNHQDTEDMAQYYKIPFMYLPVNKGNKKEVEEQQIALLKDLDVNLIILARYMQILSPEFVDQFTMKIINIHHSFLPAFIGAKPYHQAFERGVKIIGATSHYVTSDLDQGPIIAQGVQQVSHKDSVEDLIAKGRNLEKSVLYQAVKLHLEHKVLTFGNKTIVFE